jgi:hypothetical protein
LKEKYLWQIKYFKPLRISFLWFLKNRYLMRKAPPLKLKILIMMGLRSFALAFDGDATRRVQREMIAVCLGVPARSIGEIYAFFCSCRRAEAQ